MILKKTILKVDKKISLIYKIVINILIYLLKIKIKSKSNSNTASCFNHIICIII